MNSVAELIRRLHNLVRVGVIVEVDHEAERATVQTGHNLTGWIRWSSDRAKDTVEWSPPVPGEQVIVLSPGGDLDNAVIVGSLNSQKSPAPSHAPTEHVRQYPDGTFTRYDHEKNQLEIVIKGDARLHIEGDADLTIKGACRATIEGDLAATVGKSLTAEVGADATVTAKGSAKVDAKTVSLNGGKGVVTGAHICAYTGAPHSDCSSTVSAGK